MKRHAVLLAIALLCLALPAASWALDPIIRRLGSTARITHGTYEVLPDAGFRVSACGDSRLEDGGFWAESCEFCEAGGLAATFTACRTQWRQERGFE
jgi:hypothetical protein